MNNYLKYYKEAIKQGNVAAISNLALMYSNGTGMEKNYDEARRLLELGVKLKDGFAAYNLSLMHARGQGVPVNNGKAFFYASLGGIYNHGKSLMLRATLKPELTDEEWNEANMLMREWNESNE